MGNQPEWVPLVNPWITGAPERKKVIKHYKPYRNTQEVKTPPSNAGGMDSISGQGTSIPYAMGVAKN